MSPEITQSLGGVIAPWCKLLPWKLAATVSF